MRSDATVGTVPKEADVNVPDDLRESCLVSAAGVGTGSPSRIHEHTMDYED